MIPHIAAERLLNQRLARPSSGTVEDLLSWFGAVQAQEYDAAKWALALRLRGNVTADSIERAFNSGRILRTHVLRPTWHFVAAADIGWMLQLSASRVRARLAYAYRYYGVDAATRVRAADLFARALTEGEPLTRRELGAYLERFGLPGKGIPLAMLTIDAELEGVICSGAQRGKESTYALLATRTAKREALLRDEALAELTRRYFRSHGPATIRDFVWWSGLSATDAKRGIEIVGARDEVIKGDRYWRTRRIRPSRPSSAMAFLLPIYDEYLVAYRDGEAVPRATDLRGSLGPAVIIDGQVAGTWKSVVKGGDVVVQVTGRRRLTTAEGDALERAVERYGDHLGRSTSLLVKTN